MQPLDELLPANTTIVVLDTSPARNLIYANDPPSWVETFGNMRNSEYSFSLAGRVGDWRGAHTSRGVAVCRQSRCLNPLHVSRFQ
ncbi:MAG: hypothetical protein ACYCVU_01345, partial [Gammaproteobacteria bacterium]